MHTGNFPFLKRSLRQALALVVIAGLIAFAVNALRPEGISLVGDWSPESRVLDDTGKSLVIPLEQARKMFEHDRALFIDARPRNEYAQGHIQGALSLPWQELDHYLPEIAEHLETDKIIVAYCDGETCDLSHLLALFFKDMGFEDVRVLVNGWSIWQEAGLPTQNG